MAEIITQLLTHAFAAWRNRGYAIAVAWVVALGSWTAVSLLPDSFRSEAVVHVDTASILEPLLRGLTVDLDRVSEIGLMQKTLLSRPNIERVIRDTDLDLKARSVSDSERLIEDLAGRIKVERQGQRQGLDLFAISFKDKNPQLAHDVVQSLLTIFVESNLGQSRGDMDTARRFIEDQIILYETRLAEAERRISEFRQANIGLLPRDGAQTRTLEATQDRLADVEADLRDAQLRRTTLLRELKSIPRFFAAESGSGFGAGPPTDTAVQILEAQSVLDNLLASYTEKHPDVVVAKRRLETLFEQQKKELQAAAAALDAGPQTSEEPVEATGISNPIYEQIKIQVVEAEAKVTSLKDKVANVTKDVERARKTASRGPELEVELARLNRDHEVLMVSYNRLVASRETEQISRARENQAESIQFRVVEPPTVPTLPAGLNRLLLLVISLVVSLASGIGVAVLLALSSETFTSTAELKAVLGVPVLGSVSITENTGGGILSHGKSVLFWAMTFALFATFAALWFIEVRLGLNDFAMGGLLDRLPASILQRLPVF